MNCKFADLQGIFEALLVCESVHMLSIGHNDALASSVELADLLARVLRRGFVWACDWGEIHFRYDVMEHLLNGLSDENDGPTSNLAFVFADVGCGVSPGHVSRLKQLTRTRRVLDKALPPESIDRTHGPWLQADKVFGWLMRSENITRCFWRPYQEADFWRRAGFSCGKVAKPENAMKRWINPGVRPYCVSFHRGDLDAQSLQTAFPPGLEGERKSQELLAKSLRQSRFSGSVGSTQQAALISGEPPSRHKTRRTCKAQREQRSRLCRSRSRSASADAAPCTPELLGRGSALSSTAAPCTPELLGRGEEPNEDCPTPPLCLTPIELRAGTRRRVWRSERRSADIAAPSTPPSLTTRLDPSTPLALRRCSRHAKKTTKKGSSSKRRLQPLRLRRFPCSRRVVTQFREHRQATSALSAGAAWEAQEAMAEAAQQAKARRESAAAQRAVAMREVEMEALLHAGFEDSRAVGSAEAEAPLEAMLAEVINEACFAPSEFADKPLLKRLPPKKQAIQPPTERRLAAAASDSKLAAKSQKKSDSAPAIEDNVESRILDYHGCE